MRQFHAWLREQVEANRPWDDIARDVLTASGSNTENPAVGYYIVTVGEQRHGENSGAPESIAQAFLGTRSAARSATTIRSSRYTQDDFYHFAAYFSRVKLDTQGGEERADRTEDDRTLTRTRTRIRSARASRGPACS